MGLILAALVTGTAQAKPGPKAVKEFACSARMKSIIQPAIGQRHKRFPDAAAMLAAFDRPSRKSQRASSPSSLAGKVVVFTGVLSMRRHEAARRARRAGARVRARVASDTDILVQGAAPPGGWKADAKGQKLLDADHERERGHHIRVIRERDFMALV
jgi:NAD-dependent DNA ligase